MADSSRPAPVPTSPTTRSASGNIVRPGRLRLWLRQSLPYTVARLTEGKRWCLVSRAPQVPLAADDAAVPPNLVTSESLACQPPSELPPHARPGARGMFMSALQLACAGTAFRMFGLFGLITVAVLTLVLQLLDYTEASAVVQELFARIRLVVAACSIVSFIGLAIRHLTAAASHRKLAPVKAAD